MATVKNYDELASTPVGPFQRPINENLGSEVWRGLGQIGEGLLKAGTDLGAKALEARRTQQYLAKQNQAFDLFNKLGQEARKQKFQDREAFYQAGVAKIQEQLMADVSDEKVQGLVANDYSHRRESGLVQVQASVLQDTASQAVTDVMTAQDNFLKGMGDMPVSQQAVEQGKLNAQIDALVSQGFVDADKGYGLKKKFAGDIDDGNLKTLMLANPIAGLAALKDPKQFTNLTAESRANWQSRMESKADDFGVQQFNSVLMNQGAYAAMSWVRNKANTGYMEPKTINSLINQAQTGIDKVEYQNQMNSDTSFSDAMAYAETTGKLPDPDVMAKVKMGKDKSYKLGQLDLAVKMKPALDALKSGDIDTYTKLKKELTADTGPAHAAIKSQIVSQLDQAENAFRSDLKQDPQAAVLHGLKQKTGPVVDDRGNPPIDPDDFVTRGFGVEKQKAYGVADVDTRYWTEGDIKDLQRNLQGKSPVEQGEMIGAIMAKVPQQYRDMAYQELQTKKIVDVNTQMTVATDNPMAQQLFAGASKVKDADTEGQLKAIDKDLPDKIDQALTAKLQPYRLATADGSAKNQAAYNEQYAAMQKAARIAAAGNGGNVESAVELATAPIFDNWQVTDTNKPGSGMFGSPQSRPIVVPKQYQTGTILAGIDVYKKNVLSTLNLSAISPDMSPDEKRAAEANAPRYLASLKASASFRPNPDGKTLSLIDGYGRRVFAIGKDGKPSQVTVTYAELNGMASQYQPEEYGVPQ